ncbi:MAG: cupredoxin domain-containing protein [Candidatus Falkowbacteria bacterium]
MGKVFFVLVFCLVVVAALSSAAVTYAAAMPKGKKVMMATVPVDLTAMQAAELKAGESAHQPAKLTFHVASGMFWYAPNEIKVKKGDTVTIDFSNTGGMHDFNLPAFGKKTKVIKAGETDSFTFKADQKGTFEFYCSVGKGYHRMKGQIGVLLVE